MTATHQTPILPSVRPTRTASLPGRDFRALILLGGSLRPTPFSKAIARLALELPIGGGHSLMDYWRAEARRLASAVNINKLPVRVLLDREARETFVHSDPTISLHLERDQLEYRGTGGVLRDLCQDYADTDYVLVANAAQLLVEPLAHACAALEATGGDVALVAHQDGTPSSLMRIRCGALRAIPAVGFHDMKEQSLPLIARRHTVAVIRRARSIGKPVRSLPDYIAALRWHHMNVARDPRVNDPFAEDWEPQFSIVEEGAEVHATARVHDSVVLRGGRVERGAVLVRCLVGPGGVVRRDRLAADELLPPGAKS